MVTTKAALLSVSDRTGLVELARGLREAGYQLLATSGTTKCLAEAGIETTPIEIYTGQKEILDGRVKTLHPKIHAGLLARRDDAKHMAELSTNAILPIDIAVINLYPFIKNLTGDAANNPRKMIELIDVGGPTMIRAAAKNFAGVVPVIDPNDYSAVVAWAKTGRWPEAVASELEWRRRLAAKVFTHTANYDLQIAQYFSGVSFSEGATGTPPSAGDFGPVMGTVMVRAQELRYGENPQQRAALYRPHGCTERSWEQLSGKELSYNNLLDFDATLRMVRSLHTRRPGAVIVKHLNPCGAAHGDTLLEALRRAKRGDPRSHFGGVLGFTQVVTTEVAEAIREDFAEIVLAPDFEPSALALLKTNKNLRLLKFSAAGSPSGSFEWRSIEGGILVQQPDAGVGAIAELTCAAGAPLSPSELRDAELAWTMCAHVKSNAIVLAKDEMLLGVGAGQMSRIDSVELAISKARTHEHNLTGAIAASDAFFPFPDGLETLAKAGVRAVIAPNGAKRDNEVIAAANAAGITLLHASDRHFRH